MNNQFVTYEIALKLKELGFKEPCFKAYFKYTLSSSDCTLIQLLSPLVEIYGENYLFNNNDDIFIDKSISGDGDGAKCTAPLWQQVIDYFREKHNLIIYVSTYQKNKHLFGVFTYGDKELTELSEWISSYEEARKSGIWKAIELINNK